VVDGRSRRLAGVRVVRALGRGVWLDPRQASARPVVLRKLYGTLRLPAGYRPQGRQGYAGGGGRSRCDLGAQLGHLVRCSWTVAGGTVPLQLRIRQEPGPVMRLAEATKRLKVRPGVAMAQVPRWGYERLGEREQAHHYMSAIKKHPPPFFFFFFCLFRSEITRYGIKRLTNHPLFGKK